MLLTNGTYKSQSLLIWQPPSLNGRPDPTLALILDGTAIYQLSEDGDDVYLDLWLDRYFDKVWAANDDMCDLNALEAGFHVLEVDWIRVENDEIVASKGWRVRRATAKDVSQFLGA